MGDNTKSEAGILMPQPVPHGAADAAGLLMLSVHCCLQCFSNRVSGLLAESTNLAAHPKSKYNMRF